MIIDPGFADHWKVRELNRVSGSREAAYWMIRLWGECHRRMSSHFETADPAEIAGICGFEGDPEEFVGWLGKLRWLEKNGSGFIASGWAEHNGSLVSRWENGRKGGRPRKPTDNRTETVGKPEDNRRLTDKRERERREEDQGVKGVLRKQHTKDQSELFVGEAKKAEGEDKPLGRSGERQPKDWTEFVDYCLKHGCSKGEATYFYTTWKANGWTTNGKAMKDWKAKVVSWHTQGYFQQRMNEP